MGMPSESHFRWKWDVFMWVVTSASEREARVVRIGVREGSIGERGKSGFNYRDSDVQRGPATEFHG